MRCLESSKKPGEVLKRYLKNSQGEQRYFVHVASWVAFLPKDSRLLRPSVELLTELLRTRPRSKLQPWLRGSLGLVMRRMNREADPSHDTWHAWKRLKNTMPRSILRAQGQQGPKGLRGQDIQEDPEAQRQEARRFQNAMLKWHNAGNEDRTAIFEATQEKLATATARDTEEEERQRLLTIVLRKIVSAMSPPHELSEPKERSITGTSEPTTAGPEQHDLRQVLLTALPWIKKEDIKLQPILSYLVGLINRFGLRLELAASSKQWLQIGAFLDGVPWQQQRHGYRRWSEDEKREVWDYLEGEVEHGPPTATLWRKASERFRRSPSSIKAFWRSWNDPRYAPPEVLNLKHERGLIKEMVETAMGKLGEATSSELIEFLRKNPEIQKTYGHRLQKHITKINGNMDSIPAWERTVRTNVDRYFDITGRKRDGRVVYKPKPYYRLVIEI